MPIRKLTDSLYIAPQLTEADVQEAVRLGIQTVICNRPDGEEENQPAFAEVQNWFKEAGINQFSHQPRCCASNQRSRCRSLPKSVATISNSYPCLLPYRHSLLPALGLSSSATRRIRSRSGCRSRTGRR